MKQWRYRQESSAAAERFAEQEGIDPLFAALLLRRGIGTRREIKQFIRPDVTMLCDPFLLPDMNKAVERILRAKEYGEQVTVYGDYDADGLTASAIMIHCLKTLGIRTTCYIPDRMSEGYGLHAEALEKIRSHGTSLVVTVDLGVTAINEIAQCPDLDFVVTDHHQPLEELPPAVAVVDPKREDCDLPFREWAGVGVAFKLICALRRETPMRELFHTYLDLVALGTIADIVPLVSENRFFARNGLSMIEHTVRPGLRALIRESGCKKIDATAVSFALAPRINAAGRMGNARAALELLITPNEAKGNELAAELCRLNALRQHTEQEIFEKADEMIRSRGTDRAVLFAWGEGWHQGVIGIAASKLMNRYDKPVILLSVDGDVAHGSARSVEGFPIFDALYECEPLLMRFGGHDRAAGMTVETSRLEEFAEEMEEIAESVGDLEEAGGLLIDLPLTADRITTELVQKLTFFEPFGPENPQPLFSLEHVTVEDAQLTRDGRHLRMTAQKDGFRFACIGFGMGDRIPAEGSCVDLAFTLALNEFQGRVSVNLFLQDIHELEDELI